MSTKAHIRTAAAALVLLLAATGCTDGSGGPGKQPTAAPGSTAQGKPADPGPPALPAALTGQRLDWKACGAPVGAPPAQQHPPARLADGTRWECATLKAPLDYAKPAGATMGIALIRAKAEYGKSTGSLLFNFGGPGGSGVRGLPNSARLFGKLRERYDLVSFDPRGVAGSSRVRCLPDKRLDAFFAMDSTPDTAAEEKTYFTASRDFNRACGKESARVLPHVATTSAARDMDLMREVLGDKKLNYFGFSYGSKLGGVYAHLFPGNVGRMAIDAIVDPTADMKHHALNQAIGFQRALDNYFTSRGQDPKTATARLVRLLDRLDSSPLPTGSGRGLTEGQALTGIVVPLYDKSGWSTLTQALEEAESGSGSTLLALADSYNGREESGRYGLQMHAQRAVDCADAAQRPTPRQAKASLAEFTKASPVFGPFLGWDVAGWCADWPVAGEANDPDVSAPGAAPILVVGGKGDPATPYEGAQRMVDELGPGVGTLLTYEGEGHGAYGTGDACVTAAVDAYLLAGTLPPKGKSCG
ncbi:alpha/beta hydrolase [Streptomyces polyrhachis]|uniref:Alpha/beta hydrolase n=1 Tax=Streptomyces polyrhachis TaxID=1282885 RepID=A0ABW2GGD6_9ACTN